MATARNPIPFDEATPSGSAQDEPVHEYHAEASVLTADLELPFEEHIGRRARVKLPTDGHYQFKQADPFHVEGIMSYHSGYTQVAGHPSSKVRGFTTLSTSVLEGVNVLDVVTADRVVAQISTTHPIYDDGQVPSVTFLGTRFDNLRIGGHKIDIVPNLGILGPRRENDLSYFDDEDVTNALRTQYETISNAKDLPDWAPAEFPKDRETWRTGENGTSQMSCSLVDSVSGVHKGHGTPFGHVIDVPHFGRIFLAELKINRTLGNRKPGTNEGTNDKYTFELTMIRLEMGCLAKGKGSIVMADSNGTGTGGHH
jgi:hypothetical protein